MGDRMLRMKNGAENAVAKFWNMVFVSPWLKKRKKIVRSGLPLLLPSSWPPPAPEKMEEIDAVMELFREMSSELLPMLHEVCKNLHFWEARARGSDNLKVRFMLLERGPLAFIHSISGIIRGFAWESSPTQGIIYAAANTITERVTMLMKLQCRLAALLGQVYKEVDKLGNELYDGNGRQALCSALSAIRLAMSTLEDTYYLPQHDDFTQADQRDAENFLLKFDDVPDEIRKKQEWDSSEIDCVIQIMYNNVEKLKENIAFLMTHYRKPKKITRRWIQYSIGSFGMAVALGWFVKHSRLSGSDDLDRWIRQGGVAVTGFYEEHVKAPVISIRDELFETFRRRHQGAAEFADVQLTAESLHNMLRAFVEQIDDGKRLSPEITEQQMMEIMMSRYEKEVMHPLQSLLGGELARALLIQVQKLKLDIETAMLELNQILRANEINFAALAALPAFLFAISFAYLIRISLSHSQRSEGRGRAAQMRRRMLLAEAEKAIMYCEIYTEKRKDEEALWQYGMLIYALDRLFRAVSRFSVRSIEWSSIRSDILDLAKPSLSTHYKLIITGRMSRIYDCIAPLPKV